MEDFTDSTSKIEWLYWEPALDTLDSSMMKKTAADSKTIGKKLGSTCSLLG